MDWLAHPLVVATYVAGLSLLIGAFRATVRLFSRVGKVEDGVERLESAVTDLADDLREHMKEEGRNVGRLETLLRAALAQREKVA